MGRAHRCQTHPTSGVTPCGTWQGSPSRWAVGAGIYAPGTSSSRTASLLCVVMCRVSRTPLKATPLAEYVQHNTTTHKRVCSCNRSMLVVRLPAAQCSDRSSGDTGPSLRVRRTQTTPTPQHHPASAVSLPCMHLPVVLCLLPTPGRAYAAGGCEGGQGGAKRA